MTIALGCVPAAAQQDLTAGRTPAQLFAGGCSACHKSPQGLAKGAASGSVASFLRQHYTSKPEMADALAAFLTGGANAREPAAQGRAGRPGAPGAPGGPAAVQDPTAAAAPGRARAT